MGVTLIQHWKAFFHCRLASGVPVGIEGVLISGHFSLWKPAESFLCFHNILKSLREVPWNESILIVQSGLFFSKLGNMKIRISIGLFIT